METIYFQTHIKASPKKVWDTMLGQETYREWAKAFGEGSYYQGGWEEGSDILFLGDGGGMGMASRIKTSRKPEFISIEHVGIVKDGVVDTESADAKQWAPAYENYTFKEMDGGTELAVSIDVLSEHKSMFEEMWPEALRLLKELAEN